MFAFLEVAYQWDLDEVVWLRRAVEALGRVWGNPPFAFGLLYQVGAGPSGLLQPPWVDAEPALRESLTEALVRRLTRPSELRDAGPASFGRQAGLLTGELGRLLAERRVPDLFLLHGREPTGSGCLLGVGAQRTILPPAEAGLLRRLAGHLSSAWEGRWRLRVARETGGAPPVLTGHGLGLLTQREREVVVGAASGKSTKEIAYELGITASTARVLLGRACSRLGVRSRQQLLALPGVRALGASPSARQ